MSKFNTILKKIREGKGLTAKEMAIDLGIPYTTYLKYEGIGEPRYDTLIKIADYLNVSIDTLLGYTPNEYEYYKQWLLSTNQIEIDDSDDLIQIKFIYKFCSDIEYELGMYTHSPEEYLIKLNNKQDLICISKFIQNKIIKSQEADTNDKIKILFKFIIDTSQKSENIIDKLVSIMVDEELASIIKSIKPIKINLDDNLECEILSSLEEDTKHYLNHIKAIKKAPPSEVGEGKET